MAKDKDLATSSEIVDGVQSSSAEGSGGGAAREVIEVDAVPLEEEGPRVDPRENARKLRRGLGLVAAGLVIDVVDFVTLGFPLLGLGVGALSGLWLTGQFGFRWRNRLLSALACGVYCMFPPTNFFPLATILGIAANLKDPDAR